MEYSETIRAGKSVGKRATDVHTGGATLYSYFDYDDLNRLTAHRTKRAPFAVWTAAMALPSSLGAPVCNRHSSSPGAHLWLKRKILYCINVLCIIQFYRECVDGQWSSLGAVSRGTAAANEHMGPLNSPNADTASQKGYNLSRGGADVAAGAGGIVPQRRSPRPGARGYALRRPAHRRALARDGSIVCQGRPMAKDSSGTGANWATGTTSQRTGMTGYAVESRLMYEGTVAPTDMSRATDVREGGRMGIFGTALSYNGYNGMVMSEALGRMLNPLGLGNGTLYAAGNYPHFSFLQPLLPGQTHAHVTSGNSANNNRPPITALLAGNMLAGIGSGASHANNAGGGRDCGVKVYLGWKDPFCPACPCSFQWNGDYPDPGHETDRPNPTFSLSISCCSTCCTDGRSWIPEVSYDEWTFPCDGLFSDPAKGSDLHTLWATADAEGLVRACTSCGGYCYDCSDLPGTISETPVNWTAISTRAVGFSFPYRWNVHALAEPVWDRAMGCLESTDHPLKDCMIMHLRSSIIIPGGDDLGFTIPPIPPVILPPFYLPPINVPIWLNQAELSSVSGDYNQLCKMALALLHEAAHKCYAVWPEWKNWPLIDAPYSEVYGPGMNAADEIACYILRSCCCFPDMCEGRGLGEYTPPYMTFGSNSL